MRLILHFARDVRAAYLSHLDIQQAFSRALRRSGLCVRYSQGFNPHMVMSFALAVPGGYTFDENWLDVALTGDAADHNTVNSQQTTVNSQRITVNSQQTTVNCQLSTVNCLAALLPQLPPGFAAVWACMVDDAHPPLMPLVTAAEYRILLKKPCFDSFCAGMESLLRSDAFIIRKHTKGGVKPIDVRQMVHTFAVTSENTVACKLAAGNLGGLNPRLLLKEFCPGCTDYAIHIARLYDVKNGLQCADA